MTKTFYTNVQVYGSRILYRGVQNGRRVRSRIDYHPTLFVSSSTKDDQKSSEFKTIDGTNLHAVNPGNIRECRDFVKQYHGVEGFKIYGNQKYEYVYIADQHPGEVDWDLDHINICNIDIEVGSENGFPDPEHANEPITAITMKMSRGKFLVLGCGDFDNVRDDVTYIKCRDELELIKFFIAEWSDNYPDIITGWNIRLFDIPYIVNRIKKLLGDEMAERLSPWGMLQEREINFHVGRSYKTYNLMGICALDYIDLYQKYAPEGKSQESYKLDSIAHVELGERKLSYEEYGNLHTLYRDNFQLFIEYNIKDVELVERLDDKLKLIELALTLAYDSKTNYDDVFAQVRMWDALIYNHLKSRNIVIPPIEEHSKDAAYVGAFVKDPILGMHHWVASFDLNSLYPMLIQQYNISPETFIEPERYADEMRNIVAQGISVDALLNRKIDTAVLKGVTLTPNGQFFKTDRQGFLPAMMEAMYTDRAAYKKKAIAAKKELELVLSEINRRKK